MCACWGLLVLNGYLARACFEELQAAYAVRMANDALIKATEALNAEQHSRVAETAAGQFLPSLVASATGGFSHLAIDFVFQVAKPSLLALTG